MRVGRLLRVTGAAVAVTVALVAAMVSTATATAASAATVIAGCTVVSNPTSTNFTNCPGANLAGASLRGLDLSYADFAGATFVTCTNGPPPSAAACTSADLTDADLTRADLAGAALSANTTMGPISIYGLATGSADLRGADLRGADLAAVRGRADFAGADLAGATMTDGDFGAANFTDADLTGAALTGAVMASTVEPFGVTVYATLTGATVTGTLLVPSDESVTATSPAGAVATWPTPAGIPGATPGSCTPSSGSTLPLFTSTVTCQVLDNNGDVATGTFQVHVVPTTQYFTRVLLPSAGSVLTGSQYLDAGAGDLPGVTGVRFELTGGALGQAVIATGTPTLFGWLAGWDTTTVPDGTYALQSVATDGSSDVSRSTPVTVTVNNPAPATTVVLPADGATVSGTRQYLDATATSGVTRVVYEISGGPSNVTDVQIATGTATLYGWLAAWNTTTVPNGTYTLQSVASYGGGTSGTSQPVSVTVDNVPLQTRLLLPVNGSTQSGTVVFDASAQGPDITGVYFVVSFGPLVDHEFLTATPTYYGWIGEWASAQCPPGFPDGTYVFQSVVTQAGGGTATSPPVDVYVSNSPGGCP